MSIFQYCVQHPSLSYACIHQCGCEKHSKCTVPLLLWPRCGSVTEAHTLNTVSYSCYIRGQFTHFKFVKKWRHSIQNTNDTLSDKWQEWVPGWDSHDTGEKQSVFAPLYFFWQFSYILLTSVYSKLGFRGSMLRPFPAHKDSFYSVHRAADSHSFTHKH